MERIERGPVRKRQRVQHAVALGLVASGEIAHLRDERFHRLSVIHRKVGPAPARAIRVRVIESLDGKRLPLATDDERQERT